MNMPKELQEDVLNTVMVKSIDTLWPEYCKRVKLMQDAVERPDLDDDAAWRRTVESFKEQLAGLFDGFQEELYRTFVSYILRFKVAQEGEPAQTASVAKKAPARSGAYRNVGPNELCPCGSGKKFKHCHGKAD